MAELYLLMDSIETTVVMYFLFFIVGLWYGNYQLNNDSLRLFHKILGGILCAVIATVFFFFNFNSESHILVQTGILTLFITTYFFDFYASLIVYSCMLFNRLVINNERIDSILIGYFLLIILLIIVSKLTKHKSFLRYFIMCLVSLVMLNILLVILKERVMLILLYNVASILSVTFLYLILLFIKDTNKHYLDYYQYTSVDFLTKLFNRKKLDDDTMRLDNKKNTVYSVAFFDLDNFKQVNDSFGHKNGDYVLKTFANLLLGECNEQVKAYRLGGEEFCLFFNNIDINIARNTVIKIQNDLKNYRFDVIYHKDNDFKKGIVHVSASVGLVHLAKHTIDIPSLIDKADKAMYESKNKGGNTFVEYLY